MTELNQFWHLFSTRIVPVLWIIAMICAAIEFGLARLIQRLTQRGALTMPLMMMAVVAAGVDWRWSLAHRTLANAGTLSTHPNAAITFNGSTNERTGCSRS